MYGAKYTEHCNKNIILIIRISLMFWNVFDRIQIGAPRGNHSFYSDYNEPGVVYRCPIKGACKLFPIDSYGKQTVTHIHIHVHT